MKPNIRKLIKNSKETLEEIMRDNLKIICMNYIDTIMKIYEQSSQSEKIKSALKASISQKDLNNYKKILLESIAIISSLTLDECKKEVPKAKNVKLCELIPSLKFGEFEKLPPKIKKRLKAQTDLLVSTQESDIVKAVALQFNSSVVSTDSYDMINYDLDEVASTYVNGNSISSASDVTSATVINETRLAFFTSEEVDKEIGCFKFVNTSPETAICRDLSNNGKGKYFSKNDPGLYRYSPPLHWNCESYIEPVLNAENIELEQLKPSSTELEKQIQFNSRCNCGNKHYLLDFKIIDDIDR